MDDLFKDHNSFIECLKDGDKEAYNYLVDIYYKKLFVYALSLTNDHTMTQDIVQNVFLRTWEYRKKLRSDFSLNGFLYKSVYNEFINQYHRNQFVSILEKFQAEALKEEAENVDQDFFKKKIELITKEIENLPPKCKRVFMLSKKDGLTNIEIAEYLNTSIKSVEAHITKAYSLIRGKLRK
ncbi:RNA polymerase sigma factor [Aestuariivivens insulae]|uniref:RNA polymerase sigma factor n=1 Tax=Aestuariivivens insulae TaxID=1621988 RepID=UPI001F5A40A0|nr:sigma-70 family RNA polymerase sigma factor [Aestuariivivens insulae]